MFAITLSAVMVVDVIATGLWFLLPPRKTKARYVALSTAQLTALTASILWITSFVLAYGAESSGRVVVSAVLAFGYFLCVVCRGIGEDSLGLRLACAAITSRKQSASHV